MNTTTRRLVPVEATLRKALEAMIRAHETGRYEPQHAAYEYAKNTLDELAASPNAGKVTEAEFVAATEAMRKHYHEASDPTWGGVLRVALASLVLEVQGE